jgi:hypothetical protein
MIPPGRPAAAAGPLFTETTTANLEITWSIWQLSAEPD